MARLPFDTIEYILCRLPVKSLKRFRSVAKSWCYLIDSKEFVKLHFRHSLISGSNHNLVLLESEICSIDLESPDESHVIKLPFDVKGIEGMTNSCNGLVLLFGEQTVVCNPFSRSYRILPDSCVKRPAESLSYYARISYGFGFNSIRDDYSVLKIAEFRVKGTNVLMTITTEIYSLKLNKWKTIDPFPYRLSYKRRNVFVHANGAFHMLVADRESYSFKIMAFSIESEKHYGLTMSPRIPMGRIYGLDEVGGCLAVICLKKKSYVSVWIMKEYGVKESWAELLTLGRPMINYIRHVDPLVFSQDGAQVLSNLGDQTLFWYNLEKKTVNNLCVEKLPFRFYAEHCVQTLVSPDSWEDQVKKQGQQK